MGIFEVIAVAVGLAMDAFAVSICKGLKMRKINYKHTAIIALFFGGFQALMPFIGWLLGKQFEQYIVSIDHWIAFVLLAFIGGKMIYESFKKEDEDNECEEKLDLKELTVMAIATSIDALAVGITFAFLPKILSIGTAVSIIGLLTFVICFVGVLIGNKFGAKFKNKAELAGGIVLVFIGVKILLEHLGIINF